MGDNQGSRRLAVYSRIADTKVDTKALTDYNLARLQDLRIGGTADELNDFRRKVSPHYNLMM